MKNCENGKIEKKSKVIWFMKVSKVDGGSNMILEFKTPTKSDAEEIATWKYDGIYSFYDNDKTDAKQEWALNIYKAEDTFAIYDGNELIANCCFNYEEDEEKFSFGIQMKPSLTGKGMGLEVVNAALIFGQEKYKYEDIFLLVAKFNARAIKVYRKLDFKVTDEFVWHVNGEEKEFIEMRKSC